MRSFSFLLLSAKLSEYMLVFFFLERAKKEFVTSVIDVTCEILYSQSFKMNRKHLFLLSNHECPQMLFLANTLLYFV